MTRRHPNVRIAFSLGLVAALLALWLRLLVPAGWMPVVAGDGVMFTLCSGSGGQQFVVGKDGTPTAPDGAAHAGPCAFSGLGTPALPDLPPTVTLQIFLLFIALGLAGTTRPPLPALAWLRPPLRGPPPRA